MKEIIFVGEQCFDVFIYGDTPRLSPEGPVPILQPTKEIFNNGMVMNVVNNFVSLDSSYTTRVFTNDDMITKTRYVDEKTNTLLLRVDENDISKRINLNDFEEIDYSKVEAIVISDYNKGFLTEKDIEFISKKHSIVICDTKKKLGDWCKDIKFIKLNRTEYNNNKEFIEKNDWILDKLIITLDKDGCMYNGNIYPTKKVEIMDISGAGDTFVAGFTKKYLETKDVEQSIKFGNECSLKVVQQKGVSIVK